jgi:hypothetical protein
MQSNKVVKVLGSPSAATANPIVITVDGGLGVTVSPSSTTEGSLVTVSAVASGTAVCVRVGMSADNDGTCACRRFAGVGIGVHLQSNASPFAIVAGAAGGPNSGEYTAVAIKGGGVTPFGNTGTIYVGD